MTIRVYRTADREAVVRLSLRAWAPVFASIEQAMDPAVYRVFYPDWRVRQREAVEAVLADPDQHVWVAEREGTVAGFVAVAFHRDDDMGEIYMTAVDPEHQGKGVGTALAEFAVDWMRQAGLAVAMVETGGDPGHAAARRTYEKAGFRLLPIARFFKKL
ncbi:MAG: GNAT family N-acetyltransferase [Gemmatimonadota bacterium]